MSFCYIMYYIVLDIYTGRLFLKEILSAVAKAPLIPYNLRQRAPETQNL